MQTYIYTCIHEPRRARCAERRFRRSKDPSDRLVWITKLRALHRLYHQKEAVYWEVGNNSSLEMPRIQSAFGPLSQNFSVDHLDLRRFLPFLPMTFWTCSPRRLPFFAHLQQTLLLPHSPQRHLSSKASD